MPPRAQDMTGAPPKADEKTLKTQELDWLEDDEDDDEFVYEEIPDDDVSLIDEDQEEIKDIEDLIRERDAKEADKKEEDAEDKGPKVQMHAETVDDFIRNFLKEKELKRSLETFQTEWYEMQASGRLRDDACVAAPNHYIANRMVTEEVTALKDELKRQRAVVDKAKATWDKFRKERDFHRMHHRRVVQEKNKLLVDLKRLKRHYEQYEPTLTELRHKYEVAMKEKMLMRLERDRFLARAENLQKQLAQAQYEGKEEKGAEEEDSEKKARRTKRQDAPWPIDDRANPYLHTSFESAKVTDMKRIRTFKCHNGAVSRVAFHPKIPVVATVSDDHTWKMWSMPGGELVLSGEGHTDWVSGIAFHPRGSLVATTSGDSTVKIWDIAKEKCKHTLTDHNQAVWSCCFHDLGDFLVSCSMDQTCRAFDMQSMRVRQTFRGHVDSVNYVTFQPFSSNVLTASGDKTVSLWDLRSGLCVQTFYGHANACNGAVFNLRGDSIASCDSDGIVKLWDVRLVSEFLQIDTGEHPANASAFDRSGKVLAIASGDASIKTFDIEQRIFITNLEGHDDSVQDVAFEPVNNKYMISASSDCSFSVWQ